MKIIGFQNKNITEKATKHDLPKQKLQMYSMKCVSHNFCLNHSKQELVH